MEKLKALILGFIFVPFKKLFKIKKNLWVFGADLGYKYSQNSRYLFEYVLAHEKSIDVYWITQSKKVYKELKAKNLPVLYNFTIKGTLYSLTAEMKVVCTWFSDIYYTFPDKRQKVAYLMHGMPVKKIYYDDNRIPHHKYPILYWIKSRLYRTFLCDYVLEDSCFTPVTSNYYKHLMTKAMHNNNIYVYGQPRTDSFLHMNATAIRDKYRIDNNEFLVTYMPTHRKYGQGEPSPHIFIDNKDAINYFTGNNIKIIWKQHPNMLKKYKKKPAADCFLEFSFDPTIDTQEILFISDVLITDFSSCFVDFSLLKRPILFYHYDNYEQEDNELYITSEELSKVGFISKTEVELLEDIKRARNIEHTAHNGSNYNFFNESLDDKACERCFSFLRDITKSNHTN